MKEFQNISKERLRSNLRFFRKYSKTFFISSFFFEPQDREDIATIYRFLREADNFVDKKPQQKQSFLNFKSETLLALKHGKIARSQTIADFVRVSRKFNLEFKWTLCFLNSMEMDLKNPVFSRTTLDRYVYGSAEVVGLMLCRILNLPKESYAYAQKLGASFQMINFIRDIKEDLELERCYFPKGDLEKYGIDKLENNQESRDFIASQINEWKISNKNALTGLKFIPRKQRVAIKTASDMYDFVANVIQKNPEVVFRKQVKPSLLRIVTVGLKNYLLIVILKR